jgi:hypothetical protein
MAPGSSMNHVLSLSVSIETVFQLLIVLGCTSHGISDEETGVVMAKGRRIGSCMSLTSVYFPS